MRFEDLVTKLQSDHIYPSQSQLEEVVGGMLEKESFEDFCEDIPDDPEWYQQLVENLAGLQITAQPGGPDMDAMFPFSQLMGLLAVSGGLGLGGLGPGPAGLGPGPTGLGPGPAEPGPAPAPGTYPLAEWFQDPKKLAAALMEKREEASSIIQSFCTHFDTDARVIAKLEEAFNEIPFKDELRQSGLDKDIIHLAASNLSGGVARTSFHRNINASSDVMTESDRHLIETKETCGVCHTVPDSLQIGDKEYTLGYKPYRCTHIFCRSCYYGYQRTAIGDYCAVCREAFTV